MAPTPHQRHTKSVPAVRHYLLGTAGHIDHGKTSLIRALTGIDTDRLPEEKRRGLTIELGFAELAVNDVRFGIVDVPGHERFVRTMVAGATGIDVALIVVAADDSVMPQTVEHMEILDLLGVQRGVVAITKTDTVEQEMCELVAEDVIHLLEPTALRNVPLCYVSSLTGRGVDELKDVLYQAVNDLDRTNPAVPFRMAVDRVFTVAGRGTVVTGSALCGTVHANDTLECWPPGLTCRVRDLQTHGTQSESLGRGQRCALNLSGIDRQQLERGCELATPGYLQPSHLIDVRLRCLPSYGKPLKSTSIVRLELGTNELPARLVILDQQTLTPGASALAQLRCGRPVTSTYGQRFIIRDENATRTIGGGVVLRPVARRRRAAPADERDALRNLESDDPADRVLEVLRQAGFSTPTDLQICARAGVAVGDVPSVCGRLAREDRWIEIPGTHLRVARAAIDDRKQRLTRWLERFHRKNPELPGRKEDSVLGWLERMTARGAARPLLEQFLQEGALKRLGGFICLPAFAPKLSAADEKLLAAMIDEVRSGGFQPPLLEALKCSAQADAKRLKRLATLATSLGELAYVADGLYLHTSVERELRERVRQAVAAHGPVTVARVREELGSSRKYVVPFLEYLDRVGYTCREGDTRILADG